MKYCTKIFRLFLIGLILLSLATVVLPSTAPVVEQLSFPTAFAPERGNNIVFSHNSQVAFAASFDTDTLFAFDSSTGAQLGSVPTGDGPSFVALCECGARRVVAVANTAFIGLPPPTITFIDATDPSHLTLISTATLGRKFEFVNSGKTLAFNSDGTTAFVTALRASGGATLFSLEISTGSLLNMLQLDMPPLSGARAHVAGRERLILAAGGSSPEVIIANIEDPRALSVAARVPLPAGSGLANENNIVVSGDGSLAYLASADAGVIYAIDLIGRRIVAEAGAGTFPAELDLFDDGQKRRLAEVAIFDGSVNIFDASKPESLTRVATFRADSPFLTTAPALSADGRRGFVATEIGNQLYVFDAETGGQLSKLDLGGPPVNLQLTRSRDTERLGLMDTLNHRALLFEANPEPPQLSASFAPRDGINFSLTQNILLSQDGRRAFVASPTSDELLVIDTEKRMVEQRIAVGRRPERIALVEAGGSARLAVVNINSASISLVEVSETGARVTGTVQLSRAAAAVLNLAVVAFSSDGRLGFVCDGVSRLLKFDASSGELLDTLNAGSQPLGLSLFEQNGQRRLAVVSTPTNRPGAVIFVDANDTLREVARYQATSKQKFALNDLPVFSSDGRFVFVTTSFSLELLSIDASTGQLIGRLPGINAPQPTLFSHQGRDWLIAVNVGAARLFIVEVDSAGNFKTRARLKPPKGYFFTVGNNAAVDQAATQAYVANYGSGRFLFFDPTSGAILQTVALGSGPSNLALSADGRHLVVLEANGAANRINIIELLS